MAEWTSLKPGVWDFTPRIKAITTNLLWTSNYYHQGAPYLKNPKFYSTLSKIQDTEPNILHLTRDLPFCIFSLAVTPQRNIFAQRDYHRNQMQD